MSLLLDMYRTCRQTREALIRRLGREDVELTVRYALGRCAITVTVGGVAAKPVTVEPWMDLVEALEDRAATVLGDVNVRSAP